MKGTRWPFLTALPLLLGCFPDPPKRIDTAADSEGIVDEVSDTAQPDDTEDADDTAGGSDSEIGTETPLDTETLGDVAETSSDAAPDGDTGPDDVDGASGADADEVVAAECETAAECAHLDGECVVGACEDRVCVGSPSTGGPCDDDDRCTVEDACDAGSCVGVAVRCEALDSCHDAGTCEPATGRCSNPVRDDTSTCDDGLACTDDDRCFDGMCIGTERVCTASDQCHDPGECNPLTGLCTNPAKDNFTPCDDGDVCTTGDFCSSQRCQGGQPPDDSLGDWVVTLEGDGDAEIHAMVERPDGSVVALGFARGTTVTVREASGNSSAHGLGAFACALFQLNLSATGAYTSFQVIGGAATCEGEDAISAGLGLARLADGTYIAGGSYFGGPFELAGVGHELGVSPSGLALEQGMWVGRIGASSSFSWSTDLIGAGIQSRTAGYRSLVASPLGTSWLATSAAASGALEFVYGADDSEVILNSEAGSATGFLFELDASGRRTRTSPIKCLGTGAVLPTILTRTEDGTLVVGGVAIGGNLFAEGAAGVTVATGLTNSFEGWLVAYDATGPRWGRHFFSAFNGVEVGAALIQAVPNGAGVSALGVFNGQARTRIGGGVATPLATSDATDPPDPASTSNSYWFGLDPAGLVSGAGRFEPEGAVAAVAATDATGRLIVAGRRKVVVPPTNLEVDGIFVTEPGAWDEVLILPEGTPTRLLARLDGASPLSLVVTSHGVLLAANVEAPAQLRTSAPRTLRPAVDRNGATIMRINSRRGLECR